MPQCVAADRGKEVCAKGGAAGISKSREIWDRLLSENVFDEEPAG